MTSSSSGRAENNSRRVLVNSRFRDPARGWAAALVWGLAGCLILMPRPAHAEDPILIELYRGFGTSAGAQCWGRVIEDEGRAPPAGGEGKLAKLKRTFRLLESDEIPGAEVKLQLLGKSYRLRADDEGFIELQLPGPLPAGRHLIQAELDGKRPYRVSAAELAVWDASPKVAVVSDIDDTVLQTGVGNKLALIKKVAFSDAADLRSYPHAAALYRVWASRGYPIIFVSGSPVNLYPRLVRFLELQRFPDAPLLLKNLGVGRGADKLTEQRQYKLKRLRLVQRLLPGYQLILVGDSGEQDPAIYAEWQRRQPRLVQAVLIHQVAPQKKRRAGQRSFTSYLELARALHARGSLTAEELRQIEEDR